MNWNEILNIKTLCVLVLISMMFNTCFSLMSISKSSKILNKTNLIVDRQRECADSIMLYDLSMKILIIEKLVDDVVVDTSIVKDMVKNWSNDKK